MNRKGSCQHRLQQMRDNGLKIKILQLNNIRFGGQEKGFKIPHLPQPRPFSEIRSAHLTEQMGANRGSQSEPTQNLSQTKYLQYFAQLPSVIKKFIIQQKKAPNGSFFMFKVFAELLHPATHFARFYYSLDRDNIGSITH